MMPMCKIEYKPRSEKDEDRIDFQATAVVVMGLSIENETTRDK